MESECFLIPGNRGWGNCHICHFESQHRFQYFRFVSPFENTPVFTASFFSFSFGTAQFLWVNIFHGDAGRLKHVSDTRFSSSRACMKVIHSPYKGINHSNLSDNIPAKMLFLLLQKRMANLFLIGTSSKTLSNFALLTPSKLCFQTRDVVTFFFFLRVCPEIALHFRAIPDFLQEHGHAQAYVACVRVFFSLV